jgi:hypothetical protein
VLLSGLVVFSGRSLDNRELLAVPAGGVLVLLVGAAMARRHLRTSISRRALGIVVLLCASIVLHRAFVMAHGAPAVAPMLQGDLALGTTLFGAMGVALLPRMAWVCVPFVLGAVATALWPGRAMQIFAMTTSAALALMAVLWLLSLRPKDRPPPGSSPPPAP